MNKHFPWWKQWLTVMIAVGGIEGCRSGFGIIGRTVDIERLPEVVQAVDVKSQARDVVILAAVQTNTVELIALKTNVNLIKARQDKVIHFINSLTNYPPIEWPATVRGASVAVRNATEPQ